MLTRARVADAPDVPGVYLFRDRRGKVLYVGKAKSLRRRLFQYTAPGARLPRRIRRLLRQTHTVEMEPLGSELEALLVESRLIKLYQPPYNVLLRRFRRYPYLKLDRTDPFPRLTVSWSLTLDGAQYYGPFPSLEAAEAIRELVHRLFPLRTCEGHLRPDPRTVPCYQYQIGRCGAPCAARQSAAEYGALVQAVDQFLRGNHRQRLAELIAQREDACRRLQFERARLLQSRIELLERYGPRFPYQVNAVTNADLAVVCPSARPGRAELFLIRSGRLAEQISWQLPGDREELERLLRSVYLVPEDRSSWDAWEMDAMQILSQWLYANRHRQEIVPVASRSADACRDAAERLETLLGEPELAPLPWSDEEAEEERISEPSPQNEELF